MIWKILKYVVSFVALVVGVFAGYYITSLFTTDMNVIRLVGRSVGLILWIVSFFAIGDIIERKGLTRN